jgi:hypothetical protein
MNAYGRWAQEATAAQSGSMASPYSPIQDLDQLRASGMYDIITPEECVARCERLGPAGVLNFHPLMGGLPPDVSWEGLRTFEQDVLPKLR